MNIHVAIPALNELDNLPIILDCLKQQTVPFKLYICVNQKDHWWNEQEHAMECRHNQQTLTYLKSQHDLDLTLLDRCSPGKGWDEKNYGVGWARRVLCDHICQHGADEDILVFLDADTTFSPTYLQSLIQVFHTRQFKALAIPYYHKLTQNPIADRAILRYEIYMRNYALNLFRIHSPYSFTALGSAIACRLKEYKAIGGITPLKSGEDFYFLQKMAKFGKVLNAPCETVYPQARFSDRVDFGTGPAMIKGAQGQWQSYPLFHYEWFNAVAQTYQYIPEIFEHDVETEFTDFLKTVFKTEHLWDKLRQNYKTLPLFTKAF